MPASSRIAVVGLWHQGVVGAACFADWGHEVTGADYDVARVSALAQGKAPLFEPGLDALLAKGLASGRLHFSNDLKKAVSGCGVVLLMHDTPVNEKDESDLTDIFRAVTDLAPVLEQDVVVHATAQVPVGTCDQLTELLRKARSGLRVHFAYSPENLRLGQAIERFQKPPLPVLGADDEVAFSRLEELYAPCGVSWQRCSLRTAEMSKHALNSFLATSVTFANELGNLCDSVGADGHRLAELLRLEPRVGSKAMLFPGLGFSGGTLARDVQTLRRLAASSNLDVPMLNGLWASNQQQNRIVTRRLAESLGSLSGKRLAVWGLTYKPDTSTLRRSAALELIADLLSAGAEVMAHDPKAARAEVEQVGGFAFCDDALSSVKQADALVLMTPWKDYKTVDFTAVRKAMRGNLIFDTANLWKVAEVEAAGFTYLDIGRGRTARRKD